jgi:hypothetical protein
MTVSTKWSPFKITFRQRLTSHSIDSVGSTVLHPMGSVVATCSGQRRYTDDESSSPKKLDNSVKVWSMPFLEAS